VRDKYGKDADELEESESDSEEEDSDAELLTADVEVWLGGLHFISLY
jgi:hypothetical protein